MKVKKIAALAIGAAMIGATLGYASAQEDKFPAKEFFVKDGQPNVKIVVGSNAAAMDVASAADIAVALGTLLYTEKEAEVSASVVVKEDLTSKYDVPDIPLYSTFYDDYGLDDTGKIRLFTIDDGEFDLYSYVPYNGAAPKKMDFDPEDVEHVKLVLEAGDEVFLPLGESNLSKIQLEINGNWYFYNEADQAWQVVGGTDTLSSSDIRIDNVTGGLKIQVQAETFNLTGVKVEVKEDEWVPYGFTTYEADDETYTAWENDKDREDLPDNQWWLGIYDDDDHPIYGAKYSDILKNEAGDDEDVWTLQDWVLDNYYSYNYDSYDDIEDNGIVIKDKEAIILDEDNEPPEKEYGEITLELQGGKEYRIIDQVIKIDEIKLKGVDIDDPDDNDVAGIPPKRGVKIVIPEEAMHIYMDFSIEIYEDKEAPTGATTHYYDDLSTDTPVEDSWVPGLTVGDSFTLFGTEYTIVGFEEGDIVFGKKYDDVTLIPGEVKTLDGYKIEVVDVSAEDNKGIFKITNPEGETELVVLDKSSTDKEEDWSKELWNGDFNITLRSTFVGISGNVMAKVDIVLDKEKVEKGDDDFIDGWEFYYETDGNYLKKIELRNKKKLESKEINILDEYVIKYVYKEEEQEDEDGDEYIAAKAYIAIDPAKEFYGEEQTVEPGEKVGNYLITGLEGAKYTKITPVPVTEPITVLDTELDINSVDSNLILVGGPVANAITKYLVDQGLSTVDWENSDGEIEYLEDVFGEYDVLIVAGKDRYATAEVAKELMEYLATL